MQHGCDRDAHADDCPVTRLDEALQAHARLAGLISRAFELMLERELAGSLDIWSLPADELIAMKAVKLEQNRIQSEKDKSSERQSQSRTRN